MNASLAQNATALYTVRVSIYIYIYIYIYACVCNRVCVYARVCIYTSKCVCVCVCVIQLTRSDVLITALTKIPGCQLENSY
jgi:hypothetical protein